MDPEIWLLNGMQRVAAWTLPPARGDPARHEHWRRRHDHIPWFLSFLLEDEGWPGIYPKRNPCFFCQNRKSPESEYLSQWSSGVFFGGFESIQSTQSIFSQAWPFPKMWQPLIRSFQPWWRRGNHVVYLKTSPKSGRFQIFHVELCLANLEMHLPILTLLTKDWYAQMLLSNWIWGLWTGQAEFPPSKFSSFQDVTIHPLK